MEKLSICDFKNYQFLSQLKISPNGVNTAVIAKKTGDDNSYYSALYINKGDGFYCLTNEKGNIGFYTWLDDENILFSEIRCQKKKEDIKKGYEYSTFHKININGGEAIEEFTIEANITAIEVIEKGKYLVQVLCDFNKPCLDGKTLEEKEKILKEYKKELDYQVVDEVPYWFNGRGFVNKVRKHLYTYSISEGLKPITKESEYLGEYKLSSCKEKIAYTTNNFDKGVLENKESLKVYDLKTKETKEILDNKYYVKDFDFYKAGLIVALSEGEKYCFGEHPTIYKLSLSDGKLEKIIKLDEQIGVSPASDSTLGGGYTYKVYEDNLYFTTLKGFYSDINKLDLTSNSVEVITPNNGGVNMFDINKGKIVTISMCDNRLQEVYLVNSNKYDLASSFNEYTYKNKKYSKPQHLAFTNKDGIEIDGWAILPIDYDKNKKYPAILNIHGGPKAAFGDLYFHEMQYWASEGYFVFYSNPRGGDGKGNAFADIRGKYGTIDYDDLMEFTDEMIKTYPAVDVAKIGVTGGSYGGFMTNWIVGHTDRFKAAASQRSISNWVSFSNICDIGYYFGPDQMQADTWSDVGKLWDTSPLKYANKVKTPILFIHSDEDYRCWIQEAYQMFTAVKLHGVETRLCIFHGENHELSRSGKPDHRERRLSEITKWMDKYLKG